MREVTPIYKHIRKFIAWPLLLLVMAMAIMLFWEPIIKSPAGIRSADGLEHLAMVQRDLTVEHQRDEKGLFWGQASTTYPPGFGYFNKAIYTIFGIVDIFTLSKTVIILLLALFILGIFLISRRILRSNNWAAIVSLLVVFGYYPMRRFSLFLPENLAMVLLLLLILVLLSQWRHWIRFTFSTILLSGIIITNVLAATMTLAVMILWLSVLLWHRRYQQLLWIIISFGLSALITLPLMPADYFWLHYLQFVAIGGVLFLSLVSVLRWSSQFFSPVASRRLILVIVSTLVVGAMIALLFFNGGWLRPLMTDKYWNTSQIGQQVWQKLNQNFLQNANSRISLHPLVTLLTFGGLILLLFRQRIFGEKMSLVTIITILSATVYLFGPYFGVDPTSNSPRAMYYLATFASIIAVYCLREISLRVNYGSFIAMSIVALYMVTAVAPVTEYIIRGVNYSVPSVVTKIVDQQVNNNNRLLTDAHSFYWMYLNGQSQLVSQFDTPPLSFETYSLTELEKRMIKNNISVVIENPRFKLFSSDQFVLDKPYYYQQTLTAGNFTVYQLRREI